jgi:hypothetical protein
MDRRYARSMKKFHLVTIAFVVVGTLNLIAFVFLAGHGEYAPAGIPRIIFPARISRLRYLPGSAICPSLAKNAQFSVEKQALPGIVVIPLWRRKLGLKGTNGS